MNKKIVKNNIHIETVSAIFVIIFVALFCLANLTAGFIWPLYILAMALGFVISLIYPRSGLFAIIFLTIVFEKFFTLVSIHMGRSEYKIYPIDYLFAGILISLVLQIIFGRVKVSLKKADFVLIGFVLLNTAVFIYSVFIAKHDFALAFSTFKNYSFYSLFYFAAVFLIRSEDDLKRLFKFFLAGGIAIIIFIIIGIARGDGLWIEFNPLSTEGTRTLGFAHGFYLSLLIFPVLFGLIFRENKNRPVLGSYLLLAIWAIGIVGTLMRHLWVAILAVMALAYLLLPRENKADFRRIGLKFAVPALVALMLVFHIALVFPQSKISDYKNLAEETILVRASSLGNTSGDESLSWRKLVWQSVYEKWKTSPLIGVGTGQLVYVETETYKEFIEARNIHNSLFAILLQTGLIGIFVFFYFVYAVVKNLFKAKAAPEYKFALLSMIGLYLIVIMFQPYLEANMLGIFFWIVLGLARVLPEIKTYENFRNK
ncbi:MAG: O-antigen ligase family protein [Parcubacteria group bacterium]